MRIEASEGIGRLAVDVFAGNWIRRRKRNGVLDEEASKEEDGNRDSGGGNFLPVL